MDPLLLPFLSAGDEREATQHMDRLIAHAAPGIQKITKSSRTPDDAFQETAHRVVKQLREIRTHRNSSPIGNYLHYVQVVASRVVKGEVRQEHPERRSLVDALRHVMKRDPSLACWESDRQRLCGLAVWRDQARPSQSSERLTRLLEEPRAFEDVVSPQADPAALRSAELLKRLFLWIGHPIRFDQIVRIMTGLKRVDESSPVAVGEVAGRKLSEWLPDQRRRPDEQVAWKAFLERLWALIEQLPPPHRLAYLLNFTAADGQLELFWLYGVASIRRIGAALELTEEQFARVWPLLKSSATRDPGTTACDGYDAKFSVLWQYLPLTDAMIAILLGTERQKVINLRKAAGDRLSRLMIRAAPASVDARRTPVY
jgi:DNA-directed RNA polymerase specialized sigma24 family protein